MSASLLRKGMDLLGPVVNDKQVSRKKGSCSNQNMVPSSQITGERKPLKRIKRKGLPQTKTTAKGRIIKFALEEFKKNSTKDHVVENMNYLLGSHNVANNEVVEKMTKCVINTLHHIFYTITSAGHQKVLMHSRGRKARDQKVKREMKIQETPTFSDADFKRFEKEYFGSRKS